MTPTNSLRVAAYTAETLRLLPAVVFLCFAAGCGGDGPATTPSTQPSLKTLRASPYAVKLEVHIHDETGATVLYRVERDGSIGWGGGFKALIDKTVWTGQMTDDERRELYELLTQHQWFERDPVSTNEPKDRVTRVEVNGAPGWNSFKVRGHNPAVQPIVDLLERISRQRLEPDLQKLPEPGLQKR